MGIVSIILLVVFVIAALIMILVILLQDDQGEGVAGMFGGGATTPVGSRSGNVLTRFTSIVGAIFIVGAFALAWLNRTPESSDILERARLERLRETESQDWWVERIEEPAQLEAGGPVEGDAAGQVEETAPGQVDETAPGAEEQQTLPESINR
ncbi:MAG: preprotein translocase subunit SecG [Spirochaetales bacterium]|nr:preprotein translocase subunit SecG [Spirochaetales bacterium]